MVRKYERLMLEDLYDKLVCFLLVWCVLQDFVLCIILRITGMVLAVKLLFCSKDIILLLLFIVSFFCKKMKISYLICCFSYFALVIIQFFIGVLENAQDLVSMLSAIRGLILLPTLTLIGYDIHNKSNYIDYIKKYYWFLVVVAIFGLIEFVADVIVGTKTFWMDTLKLDDYYVLIKGASAGLENGTPGNWYTDIGAGYRTQKRFISIWAAPLTAGYVLLMPCVYFTMRYFRRKMQFKGVISKEKLKDFCGFIFTSIALVLTFTRQTILLYFVFALLVFLYYRKKNRRIYICASLIIAMVGMIMLWGKIVNYIYNGSTMVHIMRFQESFEKIRFLGSGIGSFGTRFAGSIPTESQYLTLVGQLGVISIVPYFFILINPIAFCLRQARKLDGEVKMIIYGICFCGLIYAVAGLVSETVAAFTSIAQYYVLIGFAWGYCNKNKPKRFV